MIFMWLKRLIASSLKISIDIGDGGPSGGGGSNMPGGIAPSVGQGTFFSEPESARKKKKRKKNRPERHQWHSLKDRRPV